MAKREMSTEQVLRWLLQFGSDWVIVGDILDETWAMSEIDFGEAERQGYLESNLSTYDGKPWQLKLTEQAIKSLGKVRDAGI
jgi:hypothetical protein